ncbi:MAG TPA: prepilin-type N-terminal cleavage/methylation domain-containing protein [Nitrospirota bacterium]|nr:prepilin-type N-terminal cleavage/methylation domain-containing protein [Nitrospirota bacterium]
MERGARGTGHIIGRNHRGFTLIELAVVIVVLGIMIALIAPRLGEIGEADLKRSARHLTGSIRFLRDEAEARKEVYRLVFDVEGGHYWVEALTVSPEKAAEFKRVQTTIGAEGSLSGQTTFRDVHAVSHPDDPFILFTPDGWVEKTFIHLRDGEGKQFTLIVRPLTGDTELREGDVEEK